MRTILLCSLVLSGCFDYHSLSRAYDVESDGASAFDLGHAEDAADPGRDGAISPQHDGALSHAGDLAYAQTDFAPYPADMSCAAFVSSPVGGQAACTPGPTEYQSVTSGGVTTCYARNCGCMNTTTCAECFMNPWQTTECM